MNTIHDGILGNEAQSSHLSIFWSYCRATHSPYLFGSNGEEFDQVDAYTLGFVADETEAGDKAKCRAQAIFVIRRMEETLDAILTKSDAPPIIIVQGDRGSGEGQRSEGEGFRWQLPDLEASERAYRMARTAFGKDGRRVLDATKGGKLAVFSKADFDSLFART